MARRKKAEVVADGLEGTVEGKAREHFEREKTAYEERTGEKVQFEPAIPVTRTPIADLPAAEDETADDESTEGDES